MELKFTILKVFLNFHSSPTFVVDNRSFQSNLKPGRLYASRQLSVLMTKAFRATKTL